MPRRLLRCLAAGLAAALLGGPAAPAQTPPPPALAVPLQGEPFPARIERIDDDWTIHLQTGDAPRAIAARELQRWGAFADTSRLMQIALADGGLLVAQLARIADDKLIADGEICGRVELPLKRVRGVILDPPASAAERDRLWERMLTAQAWRTNCCSGTAIRFAGF